MATSPNILTVDVEEWFHTCPPSPDGDLASPAGAEPESRIRVQMTRVLTLFSRYRARGTFFVLGRLAERYPELVLDIRAAGHEVASHGYGHLPVDRQVPDGFRRDVRKSKKLLENIVQDKILGYRAPGFSITGRSNWAMGILREEGFSYDASVYPRPAGRGRGDGRDYLPRRLVPDFWEIPVGRAGIGPLVIPFLGGGYLRVLPAAVSAYLIRKRNSAGQPTVIYLHPSDFDSGVPGVGGGPLRNLKRGVMRGKPAEKKLEFLLSEFAFGSIRDIYPIESPGALA